MIGKHLRAIDKNEELTITLLDALFFLRQAWHSVTQQTITNCYARAGFKLTDQVSQSIDEEDPLDEIPLARLIGINVTMDEYVGVDDMLPTCDDLKEESIVEDIISSRESPTDVCDGDVEDEQCDPVPVEPPTIEMAFTACETLRHFLQGQPDVSEALDKLCDIDRCISKIDLSRRCAKQSLITNFFRV